jgi:hypothetical protein
MTSENWNQRRRVARAVASQMGQLPEVTGGVVAAEVSSRSASEAITIGVTTGVLVFVLTRTLDKLFFGGKK